MTEQVEPQAEAQSIDEAAVASLGQHGHAAAQLEDPDHVNPHDQDHDFDSLVESEQHEQALLDEAAIEAENEALGHDNVEQFQQ